MAHAQQERTSATREERALMLRAVGLTRGTRPHPNPRVGAIVVSSEGEILAERAHLRAGEAHAEAAALTEAGSRTAGATLVVTLEPCVHHGHTPPCTDAIVRAGITRVVVGAIDPDSRVAGKGVAALRDAEITVVDGVEAEAVRVNDLAYFHQRSTGLPLVTMKMAMTLDGQAAAADGAARWITGPEARLDGHRLRAENDVVLIGNGTVISDDPRLDVRMDGYAGQQPRPAIVVGNRPLPSDAVIVSRDPIVFSGAESGAIPEGLDHVVLAESEGVDLGAAMRYLGERDVLSVMIEGGPTLAGAALRAGIVDRAVLYYGGKLAGGVGLSGIAGVFDAIGSAYPVAIESATMLGGDVRIEGSVGSSE